MREFFALFKFNFRRMVNTWMIRILALVVMGGMLVGIICVHNMNQTKQIGIKLSGEQMNAEFIVELLNASSSNYEYSVFTDGLDYDGTVEMNTKTSDNGMSLGIVSEPKNVVTSAQMEILKSGIERYLLAVSGYDYPEVRVSQSTEDMMSFAEKIAFYIITFILYLFILLCGSIITSSVALEKTSRVSELIIYRVSVLKLIYSKVLALYSIVILMLAGVGIEFSVAVATKWIDISIVKTLLETAGFGMKEIAIVVGIIIVGIMVYTVLYIFVGTMIKSADQIQFSQLPVAALVLFGFMITVLCRQNEDSLISRICTYIPTFSPFLAVTKLFHPGETGLEFLLMGICTIIYLIVGNYLIVKIYRRENR